MQSATLSRVVGPLGGQLGVDQELGCAAAPCQAVARKAERPRLYAACVRRLCWTWGVARAFSPSSPRRCGSCNSCFPSGQGGSVSSGRRARVAPSDARCCGGLTWCCPSHVAHAVPRCAAMCHAAGGGTGCVRCGSFRHGPVREAAGGRKPRWVAQAGASHASLHAPCFLRLPGHARLGKAAAGACCMRSLNAKQLVRRRAGRAH